MPVAVPTTSEVYEGLLELFKTQTYPLVSYDPVTRDRIEGAAQTPAAIELNEVVSLFEIAVNRRDDYLDHKKWLWEIQIFFQKEVDFTSLRATLQRVPKIGGYTRVIVERAHYVHPPRQEPSNGSKGTFLVNVSLHPL